MGDKVADYPVLNQHVGHDLSLAHAPITTS